MQKEELHDQYNDKEYKQLCHCVKCVKTHKEWCRKRKSEGAPVCERRCETVCVYKCEQDKNTTYKWGHEEVFKGDWERVKPTRRPANCKDGNCK